MVLNKTQFILLVHLCLHQLTRFSQGVQVLYSILTPNYGQTDFKSLTLLNNAVNLSHYGYVAADYSSLVFELKSCRDSGIYLANSPNGNSSLPIYNIHFDGNNNQWSAIRTRTQTFLQTNTFTDTKHYGYPDMIDCNTFRTLWISWADGLIQFGIGAIALQNTIYSWQDPSPFAVNSVYIYNNWGAGATGDWRIQINVSDATNGHFSGCNANTKAVSGVIELSVSSKLECASLCLPNSKCIGFNYKEIENRCEHLTYPGDVVDAIPTSTDADWSFYPKCYTENDICFGCFL